MQILEEKRKGRRDGGVWVKVKEWFGYKLHLIVDVRYEIPFAYEVTMVADRRAGKRGIRKKLCDPLLSL